MSVRLSSVHPSVCLSVPFARCSSVWSRFAAVGPADGRYRSSTGPQHGAQQQTPVAPRLQCMQVARRKLVHIGRSDVTESMVTIRSPFCGYNTTKCVQLNGEDLACYSNNTESVSSRKCRYDRCRSVFTRYHSDQHVSKVFTYKRERDTFNGPLSRTTQLSRYQKGKTNLDFTEARDTEWQWQQLGHMQVCT